MANSAYIYDAIRTPRGKGKADGSLHEVKPVTLLSDLLIKLQQRNELDTSRVEDIVMGCVSPLGEQGADIAKTAAMLAQWDDGVAGQQINRFCASGLEAVNLAAMKVASGWEDLVVAGGVESMSRVPMGSDVTVDPATNAATGFVSQGVSADLIATIAGFTREDVDAFALNSQLKASAARDNGYFDKSVIPVKDSNGLTILEKDEFIKPFTTMEGLAKLRASFEMMGKMGMDSVALAKYPEVAAINHVHTPGNSSGIVDSSVFVPVSKSINCNQVDRLTSDQLLIRLNDSVLPCFLIFTFIHYIIEIYCF